MCQGLAHLHDQPPGSRIGPVVGVLEAKDYVLSLLTLGPYYGLHLKYSDGQFGSMLACASGKRKVKVVMCTILQTTGTLSTHSPAVRSPGGLYFSSLGQLR